MPFRLTLPDLLTLGVVVGAPISALSDQPTWHALNGDLAGTKVADVDSFNPDSAANLERAWEVLTGDVSDGSGDLPETVWSATPIHANSTLYLGTPFYRILALDAATGAELWSDLVDATSVANPAVYSHEGIDYAVFTVGGNSILKPQVSDQLVAYRLGASE